MNKPLVIILTIAVVLLTLGLAFGGYIYMENMKKDNTVNQVDNDSKSLQESDKDIQPITPESLDEEVDEIVKDIENEMVDVDFEDFDAELEFGY